MATMAAYKLMRIRKDGSIGSLFINKRKKLPTGVWLKSESHPTKGYAIRPGWHVLKEPHAPHLKMTKYRRWYRVRIADYKIIERPKSQGRIWYIANKLKILKPHTG